MAYEHSFENCYNAGKLSGTSDRSSWIRTGGIAGMVQWDEIKVVNSYCTTETAYLYSYLGYSVGDNGSNRKKVTSNRVSVSELKGYASKLGNDFKQDTENKNGGYPILEWEN